MRNIRNTGSSFHAKQWIWAALWLGMAAFAQADAVEGKGEAIGAEEAEEEAERLFFVLANFEYTVAHEMAHVILDEFDIPVLGNMEVAADQLGLFLFSSLMGRNDNFKQGKLDILQAISDEVRLEWGSQSEGIKQSYWSSHLFEPQRFYNIACLIYGSDVEELEAVREMANIPYDRAFYCRDEYEVAAQAVSWVISRAGRSTAYTANPEDYKVKISYEEPKSSSTQHMRELLETSRIIDSVVTRAEELFYFKRTILLTVANCQYPDAMWMSGKGEVVLCYQLLERYYYLAHRRQATVPEDVLDLGRWSTYCTNESVADHYRAYCSQP